MKACLISAAMTGSGKTTFMLGLLAALRKRGLAVQPFKVGPDFIDPGLHQIPAGVPSHNLDGWMLSRKMNEWLFASACAGKDIAVIEGVMGLFDGYDGKSDVGSSAEMARWLGLEAILVIDASALGRSAAAVIHGLRTFAPQVPLAGVVFNRVAGAGHFEILADAVKDVPILGWLPFEPAIEISQRHLGLMTAEEQLPRTRIQEIAGFVEKHIDIDALIRALPTVALPQANLDFPPLGSAGPRRLALARDEAFSFYYEANRLVLERAGAEIVEFSPIRDPQMPDADCLYLGGGYPELYREQLSANQSMLQSVKAFVESGKRCYAECGGLMYLSRAIDGVPMAGVLPTAIEMTARPVDFGYCEVTTLRESALGPKGTTARGHQFHYSRATSASSSPLYRVRQRTREYDEGFALPNGLASYIHLHFLSNLDLAGNMLQS